MSVTRHRAPLRLTLAWARAWKMTCSFWWGIGETPLAFRRAVPSGPILLSSLLSRRITSAGSSQIFSRQTIHKLGSRWKHSASRHHSVVRNPPKRSQIHQLRAHRTTTGAVERAHRASVQVRIHPRGERRRQTLASRRDSRDHHGVGEGGEAGGTVEDGEAHE